MIHPSSRDFFIGNQNTEIGIDIGAEHDVRLPDLGIGFGACRHPEILSLETS